MVARKALGSIALSTFPRLSGYPGNGDTGSGMSRDNAETIRLFYEAEPDGKDVLRYLDPAVELYPGIRTPDQDTRYVGHDGWKEFMVDAVGIWEAVEIEPSERFEVTENRILATEARILRGRDGIEIERELPTLFTFRDGLIVRVDGFTDRAEALKAAGLSE